MLSLPAQQAASTDPDKRQEEAQAMAAVKGVEATEAATAVEATEAAMAVEATEAAMAVEETAAELVAASKAARQRMRSTPGAHHFGPCRRCLRVHSIRPQAERT